MAFTLTITAAGRAALVNAAHDGTAPVRIASVGVSPQAFTATPATAALPGEVKRIATLSGDVVAADTIHLIVRDETDASYTVRSLALYLADGTLFGAYGQATVIVEKSAQALLLLAIDVRFADIAASQISFGDANFLNPPATTDRVGVVELATLDEARAGNDAIRAVTPATAKAAVRDWIGYRPADAAGQTFTGTLGRDAGFYLDLGNGNPVLSFDTSDYFYFDRALNLLSLVIGNVVRFGVSASGATVNGNVVWHTANDGAGSGLDSDLLDGQQGSWYADIPARLGFVPANAAGQIFTGTLGRDARFYLDLGNGNPVVSFDTADYLYFDRAADTLSLFIGNLARFVISASGATINGNLVWHSGNDGAGSGLDSDLLDGQQGSWYADVPARLGFRPANAAGQTFTGTIGRDASFYLDLGNGNPVLSFDTSDYLYFDRAADTLSLVIGNLVRFVVGTSGATINGNVVWHSANDGAGSGLDSDLLDGQQGSWYADVPARLGFVPANAAGQTFTGNVSVARSGNAQIEVNSNGAVIGRLAAQPDGNVVLYRNGGGGDVPIFSVASQSGPFAVQMPITRSGNAVWDAGNDGAGSGLDADLLDGRHAAEFALLTGWQSQNGETGWRIEPDGRIMQWGRAIVADASGITDVVFPRAFPNACETASANNISGEIPSAWASVGNWSRTGMRIGHASSSLQPAAAGTEAAWQAWGR